MSEFKVNLGNVMTTSLESKTTKRLDKLVLPRAPATLIPVSCHLSVLRRNEKTELEMQMLSVAGQRAGKGKL